MQALRPHGQAPRLIPDRDPGAIWVRSVALICPISLARITTLRGSDASPVQRENSRPGAPGWEIPGSAETVITGPGHQTGLAGVARVDSCLQSLGSKGFA